MWASCARPTCMCCRARSAHAYGIELLILIRARHCTSFSAAATMCCVWCGFVCTCLQCAAGRRGTHDHTNAEHSAIGDCVCSQRRRLCAVRIDALSTRARARQTINSDRSMFVCCSGECEKLRKSASAQTSARDSHTHTHTLE